MIDIDKAFDEFIEFPEGSDGKYVTTASAKFFAEYCAEKLQAEVERLQLQLAACGVVAMANTPESAARQRDMHPDYMSASCQDVIRAVDREMALREERDQLKAAVALAVDAFKRYEMDVETYPTTEHIIMLRNLKGVLAQHDAEVIERAFVTAYKSGFDYGLQCDKAEIENVNRTASAIRVFDYQLHHIARREADQYIRQQAKEVRSADADGS